MLPGYCCSRNAVTAGGKKHELYFEGDGLTRHELVLAAEIEVPAL